MRKLTTSTLALFLAGSLVSQTVKTDDVARTISAVNENNVRLKDDGRISTTESSFRGACFFSESFSNGFEGDNGIGAFSTTDSGSEDDPIWRVADENSPCGEFSSTTQALQSSTAADGWVIFDADCWNTQIIDETFDVQGFLMSPSIDMSSRNSVLVEWEHNFRYCCFSPSPLTLGVSTDGGMTWSEFPAHGAYIEGSDSFYPVLTNTVDISCAAANESDVIVRWAFNEPFAEGYSHYFWQIDDICMYESGVENDLVLRQVTSGDLLNGWEYRYIPHCMAQELVVGVMYQNEGYADQTGVDITFEVLDEAGAIAYSNALTDLTIPSAANALTCLDIEDTIYFETDWLPPTTGDYAIRVTLDNGNDVSPEDNTMNWSISYTDSYVSHADVSTFDGELGAREIDQTGVFQKHGFGAVFQAYVDDGIAKGVEVAFGADTDSEIEVTVGLVETTLNGGNIVASALYDIQSADIPADVESAFFTFIEFESDFQMMEGSTYFYYVSREEESEETFTIHGAFDSDTDFSSRILEMDADQEYFWFNSLVTHGIGLKVESCGILEGLTDLGIEGLGLEQNQPNPFSDITMIDYTLDKSIPLAFEVKDITGKTVMYENLGTVVAGTHMIEINAEDLDSGIYTYSLVSGNTRTTRKMVVTE